MSTIINIQSSEKRLTPSKKDDPDELLKRRSCRCSAKIAMGTL